MTVLVLTSRSDATADLVVTELNRREVPVFRADLGDFPTDLVLTAQLHDRDQGWDVVLCGHTQPQRSVDLSEVTGVWYRKPSDFAPIAGTETEQRWAAAEAKVAFGGVLPDLREVQWVNPLYAAAASVPKPRQLTAAASAGLTVPPSIVTNDPHNARNFCREHDNHVIYKPMSGAPRVGGDAYELYATPLTTDDITEDIAHNAHLLQARVPCAYSVRIVVVRRRLYAVRIDSPGQALDWRAEHDALIYSEIDVPGHVQEGLLSVLDTFGLVFCSSDWIVTPEGEWVFIGDINPNGQWAWIPQLREPVTHALADILTGKDPAA